MDSIGVVEVTSIASGFEIADHMVKAASVQLLEALPICPGKFMLLIGGEVADVNSAVTVAREEGQGSIIDSIIIPRVHPQLFKAINGTSYIEEMKAVGILETFTIASGIISADYAVKAAAVDLVELRLSRGQGGKAYFLVTGEVGAVKAAIEAGANAIEGTGSLVKFVVIPSPHPELTKFLY